MAISEPKAPAIGVECQRPQIQIQAQGPARGYLNQDITWSLRVFNPGDVPLSNVTVRATLSADFKFGKATNDGRYANGTVEWTLPTMVPKQWTDLQITGASTKLGNAVLTASVGGSPLCKHDGEFKLASMVKTLESEKVESVVEILGIPSLQLEVFDSSDPVAVGQCLTYTIRVRNQGTLAASQVAITAELPPQVKALTASGNGKIEGQRVSFPLLSSLQPNTTTSFTIETQAISEGDGRFLAEVKSFAGSPLRSEESTRILPRNSSPRK